MATGFTASLARAILQRLSALSGYNPIMRSPRALRLALRLGVIDVACKPLTAVVPPRPTACSLFTPALP